MQSSEKLKSPHLDDLNTLDSKRKSGNQTSLKETLERRVSKLTHTTQLLDRKVTGVNFYMKDISNKMKPPLHTT
jgi:hypothetical protein